LPPATRALTTDDDVMRNVPLAGCGPLAAVDAILIGATTLRKDDPTLQVKFPQRVAARAARGEPEQLLRVIVSHPGTSRRTCACGAPGAKAVYVYAPAAADAAKTLDGLADVVPVDPDGGFGPVLDDLGRRGIRRLIEAVSAAS
jgi:riboflavin biosynthesis pyrimidine reductase